MSGLDQYVENINDAKLAEIIQLQKYMGYDLDVMGLDQKTVGERLGINGKAACLVTIWMKAYVLEGATLEQTFEVMENEVKNGRISKDKSYMNDQLMTSENLAKSLKGKNYDKSFLQSPWIDGKQVTYNSIDDFRNSNYKYAFIKYSSKPSFEFHYTLLVNMNGYITEHDPWPGGINSLNAWEKGDVTLESIEPKGWYKR